MPPLSNAPSSKKTRSQKTLKQLKEMIGIWSQHVLPHHGLSWITGQLARNENPLIKKVLIENFLRLYDIELTEAAEEDPVAYASFNAFFTRALKPSARPIDAGQHTFVSPVDGTVSCFGAIDHGHIFQAKGRSYRLLDLLGGDEAHAAQFTNGAFINLYLAPYNYHRVHMPLTGTLTAVKQVPGRLFSVSPVAARRIDQLFCRNARAIARFQTEMGAMTLVLVGAMNVGSIESVWAPNEPAGRALPDAPVTLQKGAEMGRFNLGSTVIVLLSSPPAQWDRDLRSAIPVQMGRVLAHMP